MKNKSVMPETNVVLIEKIKEQSREIIDKIEKDVPPENSKQILNWINQDKSKLFSNDIPLLAFIINTMHFFVKKKINNEEEVFKKKYFLTIIESLKILNKEQVLTLLTPLNEYINTGNYEYKIKFEENAFGLKEKVPAFFPIRKKTRTRVIEFDKDGKGFIVEKSRKLIGNASEKIDMLDTSKTNNNIMYDEMLFEVERQTQLTREIREAVILRDLLREEKKEENHEKNIVDIVKSITLEEFKEVICKKIYNFKMQGFNKDLLKNKKSKIFKLPDFSDIQSNYLTNFLLLINFSAFEKLIKKYQTISNHIDELIPILQDIKLFHNKWKVNGHLFDDFEKQINEFNQTFCREKIVNYLEMMVCFVEEKKLNLDEIMLNNSHEISSAYIEHLSEEQIEKINKFTLNFSIENFLKNQKGLIQKYLNNTFQVNSNERLNRSVNLSWLRIYLEKIKKMTLNFFNANFFSYNKENLEYLIAKLSISNLDSSLFDRIHNKVTFGIKWWQFFLYRINPFFLLKVGFKKRLSNQLFLYVVNNAFAKTMKSFDSNVFSTMNGAIHENYSEYVDNLFFIRSILENSKIGNLENLIHFDENQNIILLKSREEIDEFFKKNEIFLGVFKVISNLSENVSFSMKEFSKLVNASSEGIETLEKNKEKSNFSFYYTDKTKKLFNLPKIKLEKIRLLPERTFKI